MGLCYGIEEKELTTTIELVLESFFAFIVHDSQGIDGRLEVGDPK